MAGVPADRDHSGRGRASQCKTPLVFLALYRNLFHVSAQCQWPGITVQNMA